MKFLIRICAFCAAVSFFWLSPIKEGGRGFSGLLFGLSPAWAVSIFKEDIPKLCRAAVLSAQSLNISARAKNIIEQNGFKTILDLIQMTPKDLMRLPEFGIGSLTSVKRGLREEGLRLGMRLNSEQIKVFQSAGLSPEQKIYMARPVEILGLSYRAFTRLKQEGILYVGDLAGMTEEELRLIDGMGSKSVREIEEALGARGLGLGISGGFASFRQEAGPPAGVENFDNNPPLLSVETAPVEILGLSYRAFTRLKQEGILYVGVLAGMTEEELRLIDGMGSKSVREIKDALGARGLGLGISGGFASFRQEAGPPAGAESFDNNPPLLSVETAPAADLAADGKRLSVEQREFFARPVSSLKEIGRRSAQSLITEGVNHIWKLAGMKPAHLERRPGFQKIGLAKLKEIFRENGWELGKALTEEQILEVLEFMESEFMENEFMENEFMENPKKSAEPGLTNEFEAASGDSELSGLFTDPSVEQYVGVGVFSRGAFDRPRAGEFAGEEPRLSGARIETVRQAVARAAKAARNKRPLRAAGGPFFPAEARD